MKRLKKYFKHREHAIYLILKKPEHAYSMDTFHELRVEIKKLNALFELAEFCSKDFDRKKVARPFKKIFRQAGKIRELQLEEAMLKKHFPVGFLKNYKNNLRKQRLQNKEMFFSLVNKKQVTRIKDSCQLIMPFLDKIKKGKTDRYMKKKKNAIEKLSGKHSLKAKELHKLRKWIKSFGYIGKSLSLKEQDNLFSNTDQLTDLLGKWHDCRAMEDRLAKAIKTSKVDVDEVHQLAKLKTKISVDRKQLLRKIKPARSLSIK